MTHTKLKTLTLTILSSLTLAACAGTNAPIGSPAPVVPAKTVVPGDKPSADRATIRDALAAKRRLQIDRLTAYSDAGVFPLNREEPGMLNVFIDDAGSICAAANLMWQDGQADLVRKTAVADNYLRLATVSSGPLMDWMLTSGLTQGEIDRIQEPYSFIDEPEPQLIASEAKRLQAHFATVIAELNNNWDASLDAATDKLMANSSLLAGL